MKIAKHYRPELVVSKDDTRYNLSAPWFDATAQRVVATDGHRLVVLPVEEPSGVSRHITERELAALRNDGEEPESDDQRGKFPDWKAIAKDVVPGGAGTITFGLNAKYLLEVAEAIGADDEREHQVYLTVKIGPEGVNRGAPILIRPARDSEITSGAFGLIMPLSPPPKSAVADEEVEREEAELAAARRRTRVKQLEARRIAALEEAARAEDEIERLEPSSGQASQPEKVGP